MCSSMDTSDQLASAIKARLTAAGVTWLDFDMSRIGQLVTTRLDRHPRVYIERALASQADIDAAAGEIAGQLVAQRQDPQP